MQNLTDASGVAATIKDWVKLHSDNLYSWALHKTSNKEIAEDLVQDTFLAAFQSFDKFKGNSNAKTWLFSILNNKINDYYRKSYRQPTKDDNTIIESVFDGNEQWINDQKPHDWNVDSENLLDNAAFQIALQSCLGNLPGKWHAAIHLKFMEEKTSEHICQDLGITHTNFWQIMHRAKLQLRKCLETNWFKN